MRCDNCPLCPTAEDDVCPESEGKYGIEHADDLYYSLTREGLDWLGRRLNITIWDEED